MKDKIASFDPQTKITSDLLVYGIVIVKKLEEIMLKKRERKM